MLSASTHVLSRIYLHLNWRCKNDRPMINLKIEGLLREFIENYCRKTKGIDFLGFGGTGNHVHLVIQIEPFVHLSEWIGKVKGASSHHVNKALGSRSLEWQRGYGIVSFAQKNLRAVSRYVANQKEHHRKRTLNRILEECGSNGDEPTKPD